MKCQNLSTENAGFCCLLFNTICRIAAKDSKESCKFLQKQFIVKISSEKKNHCKDRDRIMFTLMTTHSETKTAKQKVSLGYFHEQQQSQLQGWPTQIVPVLTILFTERPKWLTGSAYGLTKNIMELGKIVWGSNLSLFLHRIARPFNVLPSIIDIIHKLDLQGEYSH